DTLSKASGVSIRTEPGVPDDLRLSIQARGVTMGAVLDLIGQQANLKIGRQGDAITLSPWPTLEVNGQTQVYRAASAPWAGEWGQLPEFVMARQTGFASGQPVREGPGMPGFGGFGGGLGGVPAAAGAMGPQMGMMPGFPGPRAPAGPPALTALGDHMVVIAEPGAGPEGEPGYWLTVYRLEGQQLRRLGSSFHRPPHPGPAPAGAPGAPPGSLVPPPPAPAPGQPAAPIRPGPRRPAPR
ncbi:MAG TPA: hypothetical protein VFU47_07955, partial [Armatimonadota bacterium]|nr:hypothetical protein [Armatimonadota bacterium]